MNKLSVLKRANEKGITIKLDDLEIKNVKSYEIKSSTKEVAELSIKMDVQLSELGSEKETALEGSVQEQLSYSIRTSEKNIAEVVIDKYGFSIIPS